MARRGRWCLYPWRTFVPHGASHDASPPAHEVFEEDAVGIYHCVNRCVHRVFRCGFAAAAGKSFAHRKD